jgi:hypothetical protein
MAKKDIDFKSPDIIELENKIRKEEKQRRKAVVDQILRFLGLILATIIFLITFSMNAPLTFFGPLFGASNPADVWKSGDLAVVFQQGSLYFSFIGPDPTMAITLMTLIQIGLGVALAFLYAYYIRDFIGVIRSIFGLGKNIVSELRDTVSENVVTIGPDGKKTLFGIGKKDDQKKEQPKKLSKEEKIKAELQKLTGEANSQPAQASATEPVQQPAPQTQEELDKLLTDPNYKAQQQPDPNQRGRRSLFDNKK